MSLKPGVHTNDFAPIHRLRALKLGHASLATVFRPGRLTLQPILRENLESPVLRYQPITTAVVTDACLNTRWHHGAYTSAVLRESVARSGSGRHSVRGLVGAMDAELSRPDWLATVQSGRKQVQSRVCTPSLKPGVHTNDFAPIYGRRAKKLGHASLTTVFRPSRLTLQPILRENLDSPVFRCQPITTAVVTDACLNTRWHHGAYISCLERVARSGPCRNVVESAQ